MKNRIVRLVVLGLMLLVCANWLWSMAFSLQMMPWVDCPGGLNAFESLQCLSHTVLRNIGNAYFFVALICFYAAAAQSSREYDRNNP